MVEETTTAPSVDELEAKAIRLGNEVIEAEAACDVAKQTFADACTADPTAVESLLELSTAVTAAKGTVGKAIAAVGKCRTDIDGIRYDERMGGVTEASVTLRDATQPLAAAWFDDNAPMVDEFAIDTVVLTAKREASGAVTMSAKPTGANMPTRPSTKRVSGNGERGPRGTRNVTFTGGGVAAGRIGEVVSCRQYVEACGTDASPAAQADIAGSWDGAPVSYTNEAKRLANKNGDTFA